MTGPRIKLYVLVTPSHRIFYERYFLPSLRDDFEIVCESSHQVSESGAFMQPGWLETMKHKVNVILRAIDENPGQIFIHSDVDIQFFRPIGGFLRQFMSGLDLAVQRDSPWGDVCAGFFAARGSARMRSLWTDIRSALGLNPALHDQYLLRQRLLRTDSWAYWSWSRALPMLLARFAIRAYRLPELVPNRYQLRWRYLPPTFLSGGNESGRHWTPEVELKVRPEMFMHHANWCVGIDSKIQQLDQVKALHARGPKYE